MGGIAIRDLSVDFQGTHGTVHAVRGVSLDIAPASILGLVGESGSGKSTVAFALMGLLANNAKVIAGSAVIGSEPLDLTDPQSPARLRGTGVAMIFQDPMLSLNPVFTIGAHLKEAIRRRHPDTWRASWKAMAADALARVHISDPRRRLTQYPHELSGGMRQRVVIAMALLARPQLLIADEPTTALDVTVEAQVLREILALRDAIGCSVLLITHSLGVVTQYCDQIAVLYAGEKLEEGNVRAVETMPGHPYTRSLLGCEISLATPRPPDISRHRFAVIPGELPDPRNRPSGCIFKNRCDVAMASCDHVDPPAFAVEGAAGHQARCLRLAP